VLKIIEAAFNYLTVLLRVVINKPDVVHFQWFPLLDYVSVEVLFVRLLGLLSSKTKLVLTVHNVYPHNFTTSQKQSYRKRFISISRLVDLVIVHTNDTKCQVMKEFLLDDAKIRVVHHGVFIPKQFTPSINTYNGGVSFIMYGNMSEYKGVDLFVEAFTLLPESYKKRAHGVIAGVIPNKDMYERLRAESKSLNIEWYPYFLPEQELYEKIDNSNVIVLPYRQISQSGVLLLALYFKRIIITSNLPAFKETLEGFTDDMFFESDNPASLSLLFQKVIDGKIDLERQKEAIKALNIKFSWAKAAEDTIKVYHTLIEQGRI
jgi:glycosyltransferase involved in cell wall biosynthesis